MPARGADGFLSPAEENVLDRLATERRRRDWLAGRLAAKRVLALSLARRGIARPSLRDVSILPDENGAPRVEFLRPRHEALVVTLTIAHDDGTAVAAVTCATGATVGIDIERRRRIPLRLLRPVLGDSERAAMTAHGAPHPDPLFVWTAKEAVLKAARGACSEMHKVALDWSTREACAVRLLDTNVRSSIRVAWQRWGDYLVACATCIHSAPA